MLEWERIYDLYYAYRTGYEFVWMPEGVVSDAWGGRLSNSGQAAVTISNSPADPQAGSWSVEERSVRLLGTLPGCDPRFIVYAINENGDIVGSTPTYAFLWTAQTGMEELLRAGATIFQPRGINKRRQVVGRLDDMPFLWDPASGLHELAGLNVEGCGDAVAINEEGWIVGSSRAGDEYCHPVLWKPDLKVVDLGHPAGCGLGFSQSINDRREVLVHFLGTNGGPFVWTEEAGYSALPRPFGRNTDGVAMNNRGEVVLQSMKLLESPPRAFLFSGGTLKELPPPPRSGPATYIYTSLNDLGWLVGYVQLKNSDPTSRRGFLARGLLNN